MARANTDKKMKFKLVPPVVNEKFESEFKIQAVDALRGCREAGAGWLSSITTAAGRDYDFGRCGYCSRYHWRSVLMDSFATVSSPTKRLARVGYVSRARLTQIMNLLHLAPDIQEAILCLPRSNEAKTRSRSGNYAPSPLYPTGESNGGSGLSWQNLRLERRARQAPASLTNLENEEYTMRLPRPGDRIELVTMTDDPDPVPAGTKGTVKFVRQCGCGRDAWLQIDVDWDTGRHLMLVIPPDRFIFLDR